MDVQALPYIDIQHDALVVFEDVEQGTVVSEDIWISGYRAGSTSCYGKAKVTPREGGGPADFRARDGVSLVRQSHAQFLVSIPSLHLQDVPVRFPRQTLHPPYTKSSSLSPPLHINTMAYSPTSARLLVGGPDGYACVLPAGSEGSSEDALKLQGHVGDVLDAQWFPSGEVVLTCSSDLSIRVWSAQDGSNPRTLRGHSRAITSLHIIGVGKEILSGSKDGSVRLWNVGQGKELRKWEMDRREAVEAMVMVQDAQGLQALGAEGEERVVLAFGQRHVGVFSWGGETRDKVDLGSDANLVSVAYSPELGLVATGHTDGSIALRPLASLGTPTKIVRRNEASIYALAFDGEDLLVGTAAGLPCRLGVRRTGEVWVKEEYAGWEAVGVECWTVGGGSAWCAGGEGGIRRY